MELTAEELQRYSRHFVLSEVGIAGQKRLKSAQILCIGAGGLGSPLLTYLAAAGIGTLGIIDDDIVSMSNLQRQILYNQYDLNSKKVLAAKEKLLALNPYIHVNIYDQRLTKDNALSIIDQYDLVIDGTDNFQSRYLINDACFHTKKPNLYASILQFEGQCSIFCTENGPCYRCLFPTSPPPGLIPNCAEGGVLGVLPGVLGTIQAVEAIKYILQIGKPLIGRLLTFDALAMQFHEFAIAKNPQCLLCIHHTPFHELQSNYAFHCDTGTEQENEITAQQLQELLLRKEEIFLLDVRELYEYQICNLGGYLIPLAELSKRLNEIDSNKLIIIYCKSGQRSQKATQLLQAAGFNHVRYLKGGILAWAKDIDHTMKLY